MQRFKKKSLMFALMITLVLNLSFISIQGTTAVPDVWVQKASMQIARSYPGVAVVNERIYVIGGDAFTQLGYFENHAAMNKNEEYDPEKDTWNYKEPMPTARYQFAIVTYENRVYCIGGKTNEGITGVNEVYNPLTDTWENRSSMPTPRMKIQANLVDGKIYVISTGVTEVYDPKTDTWTTKTPTSNRITSAASAVADDKIYFLATPDCSLDLGAFIQVYDPKNDNWSKAGRAPTYGESATTASTATGSGESKKIVFFQYSSTLIYYPTNDSWARGTTIPHSRGYAGVTLLNDVYYVIGGIALPLNPFWATGSVTTTTQYSPIENMPITGYTTIYITSDGRIEPSTVNITTIDNVTYTFTGNILEKKIVIERDNIILNGNGYTLQGSSTSYENNEMKYGVSLYQRQNVTIANLTIIKFAVSCIGIQSSTNNLIIGNYMRQNMNEAIRFYSGASNNTLQNNYINSISLYPNTAHNIFSSNELGTLIFGSTSANIITNNKIINGIICSNSSNNTFTNNNINVFIELKYNSNYNKVMGNTFNGKISISIDGSIHNSVYHNNFLLNQSAYAGEQLKTIWDDGYSSGGNYWIDYNGTDNDGDLIGDTPYIINEANIDRYPLMAPITVFDAGTWEWTKYYVDVVSNSTVFDFTFDPEQNKIGFKVTTENETTGFCRVTIPNDLLDVENNNWLVFLSGGDFGNVTINEDTNNTYLYFNYNYTTELVEIFGTTAIPEFQPWTIPSIFIATALAAVLFYKRKPKTLKKRRS